MIIRSLLIDYFQSKCNYEMSNYSNDESILVNFINDKLQDKCYDRRKISYKSKTVVVERDNFNDFMKFDPEGDKLLDQDLKDYREELMNYCLKHLKSLSFSILNLEERKECLETELKELDFLNKCRINDPVENNSIEENFNNILKITKREKSIQYEMDGIKNGLRIIISNTRTPFQIMNIISY